MYTRRGCLRAEKCGGWHKGALYAAEEVHIPMMQRSGQRPVPL